MRICVMKALFNLCILELSVQKTELLSMCVMELDQHICLCLSVYIYIYTHTHTHTHTYVHIYMIF